MHVMYTQDHVTYPFDNIKQAFTLNVIFPNGSKRASHICQLIVRPLPRDQSILVQNPELLGSIIKLQALSETDTFADRFQSCESLAAYSRWTISLIGFGNPMAAPYY